MKQVPIYNLATEADEELATTDIADPSQVALKMSGKPYITDSAFDPTKLLTPILWVLHLQIQR
jgi:hypothetical protein